MSRGRRATVLLLLISAVACLAAALALPAVARAQHQDTVEIALDGAPFRTQPIGALLDVDGIAPGGQRAAAMGVRSGMHDAAELMVRMTQVADRENGCSRPERSVDDSCGNGPGDLGRELRYTIEVSPAASGPYAPSWTGTAAQLQHGVDTGVDFAPGATHWVRMTAALPAAAGNEVETDSFRFGLRVVLQATEGTAGVSVSRDGGRSTVIGGRGVRSSSSQGLAATGVATSLLVGAAVALALVGGALLIAGRRRPIRRGSARRPAT